MNFYPDPYMMEEFATVVLPALTSALSTALPSSMLGIASYVLSSMALYTLATRRGIGKAWLSWVPVLNVWIIGSLSDQYRYVVKGQVKSKRKTLIILNVINAVLTVILLTVIIGVTVRVVSDTVYGGESNEVLNGILGGILGVTGLVLTMSGITVAAAVIRYMALYDIYTSMDPSNNVLFLVLSIFFRVTEAFFLFFNRNKDAGMPPRREAPCKPQEPASEPWETTEDSV